MNSKALYDNYSPNGRPQFSCNMGDMLQGSNDLQPATVENDYAFCLATK